METKSSKLWLVIVLLMAIAIIGWFLASQRITTEPSPALSLPNQANPATQPQYIIQGYDIVPAPTKPVR